MPLKEPDLKTFEAYKKAIRHEVTRVTPTGKTKFWIYKDIELPLEKTPAKKQKVAAFVAFVDIKAIRMLPALKGKKIICFGFSHLEEGKVAFDPTKGKVPYKRLKTAIPQLMGKQVFIPAGADPEADGDEVVDDETVDTTSADEVAAEWTQLVTDMQNAIAANPSRKGPLTMASADIPALIKEGKNDEALQRILGVRSLLEEPVSPTSTADLAARWNSLVKRMNSEVAAHPEKKNDLAQAAAPVADLMKTGHADLAEKQMDLIESMLSVQDPLAAQYRTMIGTLQGPLSQALKDPNRDVSRLRSISAFAVEKAQHGEFAAAIKALQQLEKELAPAESKETETEEPGTETTGTEQEPEVGLVEFAKLRLDWQTAKKKVSGELATLDKAVRTDLPDDPLLPRLQRLNEILARFNQGLSDSLDKLANADTPDKRSASATAARAAVDSYIDYVVDDPLIDHVETNPFLDTRISGHLLPALSAISSALGTIQ